MVFYHTKMVDYGVTLVLIFRLTFGKRDIENATIRIKGMKLEGFQRLNTKFSNYVQCI